MDYNLKSRASILHEEDVIYKQAEVVVEAEERTNKDNLPPTPMLKLRRTFKNTSVLCSPGHTPEYCCLSYKGVLYT